MELLVGGSEGLNVGADDGAGVKVVGGRGGGGGGRDGDGELVVGDERGRHLLALVPV